MALNQIFEHLWIALNKYLKIYRFPGKIMNSPKFETYGCAQFFPKVYDWPLKETQRNTREPWRTLMNLKGSLPSKAIPRPALATPAGKNLFKYDKKDEASDPEEEGWKKED